MNIPEKYKLILPGLDQAITSFANLLSSVIVLKTAGVSWFGIYSFIMVICVLVNNSFSSILHGQMVLRISATRAKIRTRFFQMTFIVFSMAYAFLIFFLLGLYYLFSEHLEVYKWELVFALTFTYCLALYELFKRFLYVVNDQITSFICTLIYFGTLISGLFLVYKFANQKHTVTGVFLVFTVAYLMATIFNKHCIRVLVGTKPISKRRTAILLAAYFKHGKFAFLGQMVTTLQNQGITLFLMLVGGASVVGYFNLARLLTVPVVVFNLGLTNGFTSRIRIRFKQAGLGSVNDYIMKISYLSMVFSLFYFIALAVFHHYQLITSVFPDYPQASPFLLFWAAVTMLTIFRSWRTLFFMVSLNFEFLLRSGIVALLATTLAAIILYYSTSNYYTLPIAVMLGEVTLLVILGREISKNLSTISK